MAGKKKIPKLREKDGCFVADIYRPDNGKRSTVSFGSPGVRTVGDIYAAFGKWLDLFNQHPHKVLSVKDPYEAIAQSVHPAIIVSVGELYDKYVGWARQFFLPLRDGRPSPDLIKIERLGKFLEPYRNWSPADFGPDELRAVQQAMVDYRYTRTKHPDEPVAYTRTGINQLVNQIHKMWKWAVGREIVTQAQANRLREVRPLRIGRTAAKDNLKRSAVTAEEFEAVLKDVTSIAADMMRLMWLTAMRPSEVCRMRPMDLLRDKPECWLYIPGRDVSPVGDHKTAHHERLKAIPLTASAQKVLLPRLKCKKPEQHLFSPAEALAEMRDRRFANRQTPIHQGNSAGTHVQPHPMIRPGDSYGSDSFAEAVKRGCDRAGVNRFTPYDLRRTAATRIRAEQGKEAAQLILGHTSPDTTAIYLLDEVRETMNVALKLEERCKGGSLRAADV